MPLAIEAGKLVDRFGAQAVYGRTLGLSEMRQILLAERTVQAALGYRAAVASDPQGGAAAWAGKNPSAASLIAWAMKESNGTDG